MTITVTIPILLLGVLIADGFAIKNCCNVAVKDHYFSINKNYLGVYNIIDLCGRGTTAQGYCDTITDGWLFRGGKMALKISIDFGGSMRWDLVA